MSGRDSSDGSPRGRDRSNHPGASTGVTPGTDRGQAYTLEAFVAAMLVLASVVFALQVTAVTPLTASTSSQHIENQQGATAEGVLTAADGTGSLKRTLLYWNESGAEHWETNYLDTYTLGGPPTEFGETLNRTFLERGIAFDVRVYYVQNGNRRSYQIVDFGVPSDNAVTASRTVTLYDDDVLYDRSMTETNTTLASASTFWAGTDASPSSGVYQVVTVEVVVWRM